MNNLSLKQKIIIIIAAVGAALIFIFQRGLYSKPAAEKPVDTQKNTAQSSEEPKLIFTNPTPLEGSTILPTQSVQITFNIPLENVGEFKHRLEPKTPYEAKLSDDKKTVTITPTKPLKLGSGYTLFIDQLSKFEGGKRLNGGIDIHFRTIEYKGV